MRKKGGREGGGVKDLENLALYGISFHVICVNF